MKPAEAIRALRDYVRPLALSMTEPGHLVDRAQEILAKTETIDPEPCPSPILVAILDACRARGYPVGPGTTVNDIASMVQLLGNLTTGPAFPPAAAPPAPSWEYVIDMAKVLGCASNLSHMIETAKRQKAHIDATAVSLRALSSKIACPIPPTAPSVSADCENLATALERHVAKELDAKNKAFAQLEARAQQFEGERNNDREIKQKLQRELEHERAGCEALSEMVEERGRAIVALVLNDLELRK